MLYISANLLAVGSLPLWQKVSIGLQAPELSAYTQAYDAEGFFTGVRSRVTIHKPAAVVYQSLSTNLHHVFSPMTVLLQFLLF